MSFIGSSTALQQLLCAAVAVALWTALGRPLTRTPDRLLLTHVLALLAWPAAFSILSGTLNPATSTTVSVGLQYGPAMATGWLLLTRVRGGDRLNAGVLVTALVPLMSVVYAVETGQAAAWSVAWLAMAAPGLVARRSERGVESVVRGFQLSLLVVWLLILVLAAVRPAETFQACRLDKCSVIGTFLAPGGVSNGLGVTFALMVPVAVFGLAWRQALILGGVGLLVIDYTGSRSALIAAVAGLAVAYVYRLPAGGLRRMVVGLLTVGTVVASLVPALHGFSPETATERGALWIRAKELIQQQPMIGHGPSYWVRQIATSEVISNYSAHNIWLELLVATGLIGALAVVVGSVTALMQADPVARPMVLTGFVTLVACGVFEAPVMPYRLSLTPGVYIALLLATGLRGALPPVTKAGGRLATEAQTVPASLVGASTT